jgi:hypothetical protein
MSSKSWDPLNTPNIGANMPSLPTRAQLVELAISLGKVAAAGAVTAALAYATQHQAENPAFFMALAFALRELDHAVTGK